jgi:phytanoyl-CoA hydroxylase
MLTQEQHVQYEESGYLLIHDVVDEPVIEAALQDCETIGADLVRAAVQDGTADPALLDAPLSEQVIGLTRCLNRSVAQHFDISFPVRGPLSDATPINLRAGMFGFLVCEPLLDLVEDLVGPEVFCNPTQHLRMKLPDAEVPTGGASFLTATVPWHQDQGVIAAEADQSNILTVWSPLTPATRANGCLQVVPGSHRNPLLTHCLQEKSNQYGIPQDVVTAQGEPVVLEMEPGSVLLLHQRTVHGSLPNDTPDELRISFDLRYQPVGEPSGRPLFDGFLARSQAAPEDVLTSPADWAASWEATRRRLPSELDPADFFRWGPADVCA